MLKKSVSVILMSAVLAACSVLGGGGPQAPPPIITSTVANAEGIARVQSAAGVIEFTVVSGTSGEVVPGARVRVAVIGAEKMVYADDPSGDHLPVAAPMPGTSAVRRLVLPAATGSNITTAATTIDPIALTPIGTLSEADVQARIRSGDSVLMYAYDPDQPLALARAELDAYATPFDNVLLLSPPASLGELQALLIASVSEEEGQAWSHINVDRYLAGRIGQAPASTLGGDLNLAWAYPVFEVFPGERAITLEPGTSEATLIVNWRSRNPDPPPPWSFFVSSDDEARVTLEPQSFALAPDSPPQEILITVDKAGLTPGEYTVTVYFQPFSEAFGLIEQTVEKTIIFRVAEIVPTPTQGPQAELAYTPSEPREGDLLQVTAAGFQPNEAVLFEFIGAERNVRDGLPVADEEGIFRYDLNLDTIPQGTYTLRVTGTISELTGELEVLVGEGVADALVDTGELNLRTGPDYVYPVLEILARGDALTVVGTNEDDSWIEVVSATGEQGWVVTDLVDLNIDLATVPWNPNVPAPP